MSMPAIQAYRQLHPDYDLALLIKPSLLDLWRLHNLFSEIIPLDASIAGTFRTSRVLRRKHFARVMIFPNSFRSALIPFLAGIPVRRGVRGHARSFLMTDVVPADKDSANRHQSWEYFSVLDIPKPSVLGMPELCIPAEAIREFQRKTKAGPREVCVGLIPGAAYGAAKRWPAENYIEAARTLVKRGLKIIVFGARNEARLCDSIAEAAGEGVVSLGGRTNLAELAAGLRYCRVVISNDNGGMHLAAAVGARLVALFGRTDPSVTGPLGSGHVILCDNPEKSSRDLDKDSIEAIEALKRIPVDHVVQAATSILEGS
jgi:heptosyltransferase II